MKTREPLKRGWFLTVTRNVNQRTNVLGDRSKTPWSESLVVSTPRREVIRWQLFFRADVEAFDLDDRVPPGGKNDLHGVSETTRVSGNSRGDVYFTAKRLQRGLDSPGGQHPFHSEAVVEVIEIDLSGDWCGRYVQLVKLFKLGPRKITHPCSGHLCFTPEKVTNPIRSMGLVYLPT